MSKSIVGAMGAKDFAAEKESGGRLNLCLRRAHKLSSIFPMNISSHRSSSLSASSRIAILAVMRRDSMI
jgi:hypothetical protein